MLRTVGVLILAFFCTLARAEIVDIDNAELNRLLAAGTTLVDIRTQGEWEQTGIIPGSRLMTFFDEQGRSNAPQWLERLRNQIKPGEPVILICRTGNRTRLVAQYLNQQGIAKVYNVRQGIVAWSREGKPTTSAAQALSACRAAPAGC